MAPGRYHQRRYRTWKASAPPVIDLHSHTTASDGEHSPEALLSLARAAGVTVLSVTDHDTVAGLSRAGAAAEAEGLLFVPGIEVSATASGREVHVLGHFVDAQESGLARYSERLKGERGVRMGQMVQRMGELGFPVTLEEVERIGGGAHLGRPHLALALLNRGYVSSTKEAFDRFLADGRPGHVDRFRVSAEEAVRLLHAAGGTATLAHPGPSKVTPPTLQALAHAGLDGLEVFHADHVPSQREAFLRTADALGLIPTGGSDYHGARVSPGRKPGGSTTPPEAFARLQARAEAHRKAAGLSTSALTAP
jgi:predicted metal-dependent phosphoesterase TrpH